jgi:serine/threonine-protein phosphatase 2B catalytic subunit
VPQTPTQAQFFASSEPTKPDLAFLKNHFYREGRLSEEQALYIIEKATEILRSESNMLTLEGSITSEACTPFQSSNWQDRAVVCGDIHGQYVRFLKSHHWRRLTRRSSI